MTTGNLLFAVKGGDLEAEAPVVGVHRHDGGVVDVHEQAPRHLAPPLAHQVTALREEVLALPRGRDQARLTGTHKEGGSGREGEGEKEGERGVISERHRGWQKNTLAKLQTDR